MINFKKTLFSTRTMTVLLLIYCISMAVATFVENDYDTSTAKVLVYNATWFEILMLWLIVLFVVNIKTYQLTRKEKWPILLFHLAFIFIFLGGAITRYTGVEGQMPIEEGETTNEIISDLTYFKLSVTDGDVTRNYEQYPYMMSHFDSKNAKWPLKRSFKKNYIFNNKTITLKTLDYIPLAKDSILQTETGKKLLNIISIQNGVRTNHTIFKGESKSIGGILFSYNNLINGAVQIADNNNELILKLPNDGQYMSMSGQQKGAVIDPELLSQNSGVLKANEQTLLNHRTLYTFRNINFVIPNKPIKGKKVYYSGDKNDSGDKNTLDAVWVEIKSGNERDTLLINGGKGVTKLDKTIQINGLNVSLGFGSKIFHTDFYLRCDDFILDRYPGSNNPSSYESMITIIDSGEQYQHHIYMNNVVDYSGYRFFQASYFQDESGTILSVNADKWGTNITYLGYILLFIGMFFTLFWKGTYFWKLNNLLKKMHTKAITLFYILLFFGTGVTQSFSQNNVDKLNDSINISPPKPLATTQFATPDVLGSNRIIDQAHAKKFGRLLVQDYQGRIKPMNTHTLELLRKLYKKDSYKKNMQSITPEQWFISMQIDPGYWANEPLIKVSEKGGDKLINQTGANKDGYTSYSNLVDLTTGSYKLQGQNSISYSKRKADQTNYDKAVIELTERFNIFSNIAFGYYTRVIPLKNDDSHTWRSWIYSSERNSVEIDTLAYKLLTNYFNATKEGLVTGNWNKANNSISTINNFQQIWGEEVTPEPLKVTLEILYNQINIFFWLMICYSFLGILMIILSFTNVLLFSLNSKYRSPVQIIIKILFGIMILALTVQAIALGVRWYLSGHAPWSNGYEAIIFISGIGVFSGLLLYKNRNVFIPAAGALVAMIMMGFAHGGAMLDPQITPLEPVLKSYWLMIHVGIITSSYGFFGLSAVLSIISLTLLCLRPSKQTEHTVKELTIVNEMAMTIGVFTLTIGTFLGGMWANESWGRYWSWDPKETWAFISIIIYAVVLHLRLVPKLRGKLILNIASLWAIWSIIFTYFGVNYYLSGLHSYAAGNPIPVPLWIYIAASGMLFLTFLAYFKNKKI